MRLVTLPYQRPDRGDTLSWVHWFNHERLHGTLGDIPSVEFEAAYNQQAEPNQPVGIQ